ncbi:MAG: alpha/beta fold hydrolase [Gammaproteobacteria bacterium]|nr:alpha/beta fold hydrolase [Gammaproteobacteria bacterium]
MSVELHHTIHGEGEPIIILHGLFGSSRNWRSIAGKLAEEYQVITVDLRNHGQSGHVDTMTYSEMADDIHHLMTHLSLDKVSLIGHSMGGKVAMMTVLQKPASIKQLIVLDIAPVRYERSYGKLFAAMENLPLDAIRNRKDAEDYLNRQINDAGLSQFLVQNLVRLDQGFTWRLNLPAIKSSIEYIAAFPVLSEDSHFKGPALFLGGENSDCIQAKHHKIIHDYFPRADIKMIANTGHMLHTERPDTVIEAITAFLQQNISAKP